MPHPRCGLNPHVFGFTAAFPSSILLVVASERDNCGSEVDDQLYSWGFHLFFPSVFVCYLGVDVCEC